MQSIFQANFILSLLNLHFFHSLFFLFLPLFLCVFSINFLELVDNISVPIRKHEEKCLFLRTSFKEFQDLISLLLIKCLIVVHYLISIVAIGEGKIFINPLFIIEYCLHELFN